MRDEQGWLDDLPDEEAPATSDRSRRRRLVLAAAVPWLLLPLLLLVARGGGEDNAAEGVTPEEEAPRLGATEQGMADEAGPEEPADEARPEEPADTDAPEESPDDEATPEEPPDTVAPEGPPEDPTGDAAAPGPDGGAGARGGWTGAPLTTDAATPVEGRVAAAAELGVRTHVTSLGDAAAYVDHARAEWAEEVGPFTVVRVSALVLTGNEDGWEEARIHRFAVALHDDPGSEPRAAGPPWEVAAPEPVPADSDLPDAGPAFEEADQPPDGLEAALREAGYEEPTDVVAHVAAELPDAWLVTFEAETASDPSSTRQVLVTGEPPRVMGLPPDPSDERAPPDDTER
ncbi:hypothetical protein ER308_06310 [Egibacter rhizosphaerae]|uniref:Uncharacterized protein n=1 Tax=Egibacter rhizosphaerae TaxID=1670831 RepID=A0A411YD86_9ACTN|nr:hypothetical protein [Egibacter rhizosphaerae]QBI19189.1 hypothetical protein ER308_06310 [Egibacter rhizosphaerae]